MTPGWAEVAIGVVMVILSGGIQLAICAFFLGQLKQAQTGFEDRIEGVTKALEGLLKFERETIRGDSDFSARLLAAERGVVGVDKLREDFIEFRATMQGELGASKDDRAHLRRDVQNLSRQMAHIGSGGAGRLVEFPGQP